MALDAAVALAVVEAMPDVVLLVAPDGTIEGAGNATSELLGYAPDELVGVSVEQLVPEAIRERHVAHREGFGTDPDPRPMGVGLHLKARRKDGSLVPIDVSLTPFDDTGCVMAILRDQTQQHAERAERDMVQQLLDATTEGVFVFPSDTLEFSYVNRGASRQTGYSRPDLLGGMTPLDIKSQFTEESFRELIRPLVEREVHVVEFETLHRRSDGVEIPVEVMLHGPDGAEYAVRDDGGTAVLVALVRDVSERLAAEGERDRHRLKALADQQRMAMLEDRDRIAADLHDMVIQRLFAAGMRLEGTAPLLSDPVAAGRVREIVDDLDATIREIRQAIFDLHEGAATQALSTVVRDVVSANESYLGFRPTLTIDGDLGSVSPQVADQLVPVITEALSNVARHARAQTVTIDLRVVGGGVDLTISDDGVGLPDDLTPGTGLGNLARRAGDLGGAFSTSANQAGPGTTVHWSVLPRE